MRALFYPHLATALRWFSPREQEDGFGSPLLAGRLYIPPCAINHSCVRLWGGTLWHLAAAVASPRRTLHYR